MYILSFFSDFLFDILKLTELLLINMSLEPNLLRGNQAEGLLDLEYHSFLKKVLVKFLGCYHVNKVNIPIILQRYNSQNKYYAFSHLLM